MSSLCIRVNKVFEMVGFFHPPCTKYNCLINDSKYGQHCLLQCIKYAAYKINLVVMVTQATPRSERQMPRRKE